MDLKERNRFDYGLTYMLINSDFVKPKKKWDDPARHKKRWDVGVPKAIKKIKQDIGYSQIAPHDFKTIKYTLGEEIVPPSGIKIKRREALNPGYVYYLNKNAQKGTYGYELGDT